MVFGMKTIGLLGTRLILESDFLEKRLHSEIPSPGNCPRRETKVR